MKGLKIIGLVVGALVVFAAVVVGLALSPAVQTWALRKAVANQPGFAIGVAEIDAGFSGLKVTDFSFTQDGIVVTAKGVSAQYSTWDYISNRRINADQIHVQELVIDLRQATAKPGSNTPSSPKNAVAGESTNIAKNIPTTTSGIPAPDASRAKATTTAQVAPKTTPFDGLLHQLQLALDVRVGAITAQGRALLPDNQTVIFNLKGARLEAGQKGTLDWTVDFADSKVGAALSALRTSGTVAIRISPDRRIDLVELEGAIAALGPKIPADKFKLALKAEQPSRGGNETYSATIGIVRATGLEPLLKTSALWNVAAREITGNWEVGIRSEQLAEILAGLGLPEIAANGSGQFTFKPGTNAATASGNLTVLASQLQKFAPDLAAIGSVKLTTTFDGGFANEHARLEKIALDLTAADGRKFAQISLLQPVTYSLKDQAITLTNSRAEAARISFAALPLAWAQPIAKPFHIESGDLSLTVTIEAESDGSRIRVRTIEPLSLRGVTIRDAQKKALIEALTLSLRPTIDYSPAKLSAQLSDLIATLPSGDAVRGTLSAEITELKTSPAIAFNAQLQSKIISALKPYLPFEIGPLDLAFAIAGRHEGTTVRLTQANVSAKSSAGGLLFSEELLQPIQINLQKTAITPTNPATPTARVRLGEIPLAWGESFLPKSKLSGTFGGTALDLTLRTLDDLTVITTEPVTLRAVSAVIDGQTLAQNLDLSTQLSATHRAAGIAYDIKSFSIKQGSTPLATLVVAGTASFGKKLHATAQGTLSADLPALTQQPVLTPYATLKRGLLKATFDATLDETSQVKAVITLTDLVAKQNNLPLGTIETSINARLAADGTATFTAPLTLTQGTRKSDLALAGTLGLATDKKSPVFSAKIGSNVLVVDDFQALAVLAPAATPLPATTTAPSTPERSGNTTIIRAARPSAPVASSPNSPSPGSPAATTAAVGNSGKPTRDAQPFWQGASGKAELDLKRIVYGKDYVISGVRGSAVISPTQLSLDGLEGRFKENPFKLAGGIRFASQLPKPYALTASADVQNFDVGAFLRASNPDEKPTLETKATVTARLSGHGSNMSDLALNAFGKFEITGTKGVARALSRKGGAGAAVNLASFGLSVLGAARGSDTASAVGELARALNEVPFDSLKIQVERAPDLSFKLSSLEILSPNLHLTGTGGIASKTTDDLPNAPINVVLQLGAKGELGYLLQKVGMLGTQKDDKGYQLMSRSFTLGGTLAKPDSGALWKILGEAALGALVR